MPNAIYTPEHLKSAFHLRYTWTGWPTAGTHLPPEPAAEVFKLLDAAWQTDRLRRIATNWSDTKIQFTFSTTPQVAPTLFVARVKGRLQHALRQAGTTVRFSRKVAFRGIGENHSREVANYVASQVEKEIFIDPRVSAMLARFTTINKSVALSKPSETSSGRYWYNLHVVLVVASRGRLRSESVFSRLDQAVVATANKHNYQLAVRAWMPDHLHLALRGNVDECPEAIAISLMNNTAYAIGQNAIWQRGYYAGTFSEYDIRSVRIS